MSASIRISIVLSAAILAACKSVPVDSCGRPETPEHPSPVKTTIQFAASVQPNSFVGLVLDSTTKLPLRGVLVILPLLRQTAYSDSLGVFRFRDLPDGWHRVQVRRIGFEVRNDSVQISRLAGGVAVYDLPRRNVECADIAIQKMRYQPSRVFAT